jgi:hypothetical protein
VPAAAACARYPADDACHYCFIYLFIICYHLVPAAAACVRHLQQHDACHCYLFTSILCFIHPTLFSACSSSIREASCRSMMPAIIINSCIYSLVPAAAACIRHPAGHAIIVYLFKYCL